MNSKIILTALFLLIGINAFAQEEKYRDMMPLISTDSKLIIAKDGTLFLASYSDLYRCEKEGKFWTPIEFAPETHDMINDIMYQDGVLAVAAQDEEYHLYYTLSYDEGKTWKKLDFGEHTKGMREGYVFGGDGKLFFPFEDGHMAVLNNKGKTQIIKPKYEQYGDMEEYVTEIFCYKNTLWAGTLLGHIYNTKNNFKKQEEVISPYYQHLNDVVEDTVYDDKVIYLCELRAAAPLSDYNHTDFKRLKNESDVTPIDVVDESDEDEIDADTVKVKEVWVEGIGDVVVVADEAWDDEVAVDTVRAPFPGAYNAPEIKTFRIVGNYYITQSGKISDHDTYITPKDNINWEKVDSISWYDTTDSGNLMTVSKNGYVTLLNENLHPIWLHQIPIENQNSAFAVYGENLYSVTGNTDLYITNKDGVTKKATYSSRKIFEGLDPDEEPKKCVKTSDGKKYATSDSEVFCRDSKNEDWYRIGDIGEYITNIWIRDGKVMVADYEKNKFEVDPATNALVKASRPKSLFANRSIKKLKISEDYLDCLGGWDFAYKYYELKDNMLVCVKDSTSDKEQMFAEFYANMPESIDSDKANLLVDLIEQSIVHPEQEQFHISYSQEDKEEYLEHMELVFGKYYTDEVYPFFKDFADKIETIPEDSLRLFYSTGSGNYATGDTRFCVTFTLSDGTTYRLSTDNDYQKYMYNPWVFICNGEPFNCPSIRLGELINELTNGAFIPYPYNTKAHAIFDIASDKYDKLHKDEE